MTQHELNVDSIIRHPAVGSVRVLPPEEDGTTIIEVTPENSFCNTRYGVFFFSDQPNPAQSDIYGFCLNAAVRADELGLDAIWTPERHFTQVGAACPSPSLLSAALSMVTKRIALRAGSVVLPLHHPIRVAEEWAMVDQLSGGRAGVSFASGWVPDDFVLAPDRYETRRVLMETALRDIRALWSGNAVDQINGLGQTARIRVSPLPVQRDIPIWFTAATSPETFAMAGRLGVNVLTALLQLSIAQLHSNIGLYRSARADANLDPLGGNVTVMVHTHLLEDAALAEAQARPALRAYFRSQSDLRLQVAKALGRKVGDNPRLDERVLDYSVDSFIRDKCLVGSPASTEHFASKLIEAGADEIACLIDFGVAPPDALTGIASIAALKRAPLFSLERDLNATVRNAGHGNCRVRITPFQQNNSR